MATCACSCVSCCSCLCTPKIPDYPKAGKYIIDDTKRSVIVTVYGTIFNMLKDHVLINWFFNVEDIPLKGPNQVLISYATDDKDCPPAHGKWLGEFFKATVNADGGSGHTTYLPRF